MNNKQVTTNDIEFILSNQEHIFSEKSDMFDHVQLEGGLAGGVQLLTIRHNENRYILKAMGQTATEKAHSEKILSHITGLEPYFTNMASVYGSFTSHDDTLYGLFEYLPQSIKRVPSIPEMLHISSLSYRASLNYDYTLIQPVVKFEACTLSWVRGNGTERYTDRYFRPFVTPETHAVVEWMKNWAHYFINDKTFKEQYLECLSFIHRDIHRKNIIIIENEPYLIDYNFSDVDCRLIELTRPINIYIEPREFLPMYNAMKEMNDPYFSVTEKAIIDRILILDIMACIGWEANEIQKTNNSAFQQEMKKSLIDRLSYLSILMQSRKNYHLADVPSPD